LHTGQVITDAMWEKIYFALCKLKDYEDSGLSPDEVEAMIDLFNIQSPERK